jgi:hypothetical protein
VEGKMTTQTRYDMDAIFLLVLLGTARSAYGSRVFDPF